MRRKVLVPGTFDLLHYGHMRFLAECAKLGPVTVALATDEHAHAKRAPIMMYHERKEALLHLPYVDMVTPKEIKSLVPTIFLTKADIVCYGSDWDSAEWSRLNGVEDRAYLQMVAFTCVKNPMVISTTEIISRIANASR